MPVLIASENEPKVGQIHGRVPPDVPLEYRPNIAGDCQRVCVPTVVAGDATALVAAYLAAHGFDIDASAAALDIGDRAVNQFTADFRTGDSGDPINSWEVFTANDSYAGLPLYYGATHFRKLDYT